MTDIIGDVRTLPGGQFIAACIAAVEDASLRITAREASAVARGQGAIPENLREAALLAAAAEMLAVLKSEGDRAAAEGKDPPFLVKRALSFGRPAFQKIDRGLPRKEAA